MSVPRGVSVADPKIHDPEFDEGPPAPEGEVDNEIRLGSSQRGRDANSVLIALARAARSFLLYDPQNEAIRHFLDALRRAADAYFATHGVLPLDVRPFDMVSEGEVVYHDRDRERSIAFRLYRDGVRKVTLDADLPWTELLKLLEILSIRYTGIRQTEDDMVVLLWKAGFKHIHIEAVEGFVADEDAGEDGAPSAGSALLMGGGAMVVAPADFDLPIVRPENVVGVRWHLVQPAVTEELRLEDDNTALPTLCVRLVAELCRIVADPTEEMRWEEALPALTEIRDFLLSEALLQRVLEIVIGLSRIRFPDAEDDRGRVAFLASFADEHALGRLVHGASRLTETAPRELIELLDAIPGNHLLVIVRLLGEERSPASRRVARSLLERFVPRAGVVIAELVGTVDPVVAAELLRVLRAADPERALETAAAVMAREDAEVQQEALHCTEGRPTGPAVTQIVTLALRSPHTTVRITGLEEVGRRHMKTLYAAVQDRLRVAAPEGIDGAQADAYAFALYGADAAAAERSFREWTTPRGFLRQVFPGHQSFLFVGISGLGLLPGDDSEALIRRCAEGAGEDVRLHCTATMVRRRRRARGTRK